MVFFGGCQLRDVNPFFFLPRRGFPRGDRKEKVVGRRRRRRKGGRGGGETNVNRNQAGVQPFMRNSGPSCLRPWDRIWRRLWVRYFVSGATPNRTKKKGGGGRTEEPPAFEADWIRLLSTSAGAQMVVATVPAISEASMCVLTSSWRLVLARRRLLAAVYLWGGVYQSNHLFQSLLLPLSPFVLSHTKIGTIRKESQGGKERKSRKEEKEKEKEKLTEQSAQHSSTRSSQPSPPTPSRKRRPLPPARSAPGPAPRPGSWPARPGGGPRRRTCARGSPRPGSR